MWSMVGLVQIINYSAIFTLYYPKALFKFNADLTASSFDINIFVSLYNLHYDQTQLETRQSWDYRFENQGIEYTSILLNCSDLF
mmetsp:Transcript_23142/g.23030  ORF Transcript_23142/g.23030 Transcript_23142/m.23030 type:complete len:84 (+) Transcript_23142:221-472(+)